ncbi:hypothetical protein ACFFQF_17370 [Haladaptatus pallidirubidus]
MGDATSNFPARVSARSVSVFKKYYIISEGLEPIIQGTTIADCCKAVYASRLDADSDSAVTNIQRPISFTDKTQYLYEINKGITPETARENPYQVNDEIASEKRRIPFENMIYMGDGITDIPCFSLVKNSSMRCSNISRSASETTSSFMMIEKPRESISTLRRIDS